MQEGKDFVVNPDGSVTILNDQITIKKTHEDELEAEYNDLVYNMSHPERFSDQEMADMAARRAELHKKLNKDKYINAMADMKAKARAKLEQQAAVANQKKQND